MLELKPLKLKKRWLGYIVTWQLLAVALGMGFGNSLPTAQAEDSYNASHIYSLAINPLDNSPWIFWNEGNTNTFVISHFDAAGKPLDVFRFPSNTYVYRKVLGVDFAPEAPRFYEYSGNGINEYNLKTGAVRRLISADAFQDCKIAEGRSNRFGYNAEAKHLYIGCYSQTLTGDNYGEIYHYVIEAATGKILKKLDKGLIPVGAKPGTNKLYAKKEYLTYDENKQPSQAYDIIALDIKTEQPTTDAPIVKELLAASNELDRFDVNIKTGDIYFSTLCCDYRSLKGNLFVYSAQHAKLKVITVDQTSGFGWLLNAVTNQIYTSRFYYNVGYLSEAYSLNNLEGPRLAHFDWYMLQADNSGMIYAQAETLQGYAKNPGFGLVIINPQTFSVMRFISLQSPEQSLQDKVTRLAAPPAGFNGRFFPETGHTLEGKFLAYWEKNGGLARFGYPITEPFQEYNTRVAQVLTVQYFERHRFEIHPENAGTSYEILLGTLGRNFSAFSGPRPEGTANSGETVAVPGGVFFKETGHKVTGKIYEYWKANGGLAQHGLPLTEPTEEVNPIDGKLYTVQYFERSRLELHPENAGTQYEVLMGHFGVQYLRARGWNL